VSVDQRSRARVDVVVVTYNSADHIRACVAPLCAHPEIAVTVVDNDSADQTLERIADLDLAAIPRHDNRGFGFACIVVFLNPDSRAEPESIVAMADRLEEAGHAAILGPQIVDDVGVVQLSQRRFPSLGTSLASALFVPRIWPTTRLSTDIADPPAYSASGSPDWVSGACLAIRRDVLESTGGFDERFFMYYEDMDLCRRVRDQAYEVRYDPSIQVMHVGGASAPRARLIPVMTESKLLYTKKHSARLSAQLDRCLTALHALTHLALTTQGAEGRRGYLRALRISVSGVKDSPRSGARHHAARSNA
jgi:N-acetylglucosaminyl-diphospho-decaprenol L-rhamnosyltransferase